MTAPEADLTGWTVAPFTAAGYTYDVYRRGEGPGVVLIPEMPGLHPGVLALGNHLVDNGFTVASPSLYGTPGAPGLRVGAVRGQGHPVVVDADPDDRADDLVRSFAGADAGIEHRHPMRLGDGDMGEENADRVDAGPELPLELRHGRLAHQAPQACEEPVELGGGGADDGRPEGIVPFRSLQGDHSQVLLGAKVC